MTRADLIALAERVELCDGSNRHAAFQLGVEALCAMGRNPLDPNPALSIDAAFSLIDNLGGPFIAAMGDIAANGLPGVCLCTSTDPVREVWGIGYGHDYIGKFARAATAAALRARAEDLPHA